MGPFIAKTDKSNKILTERYLARDDRGNLIENADELFRRVAKAVAEGSRPYAACVEDAEKSFYKIMTDLDFLPNSPTLMNAGRPIGQLSACFVLPVEDSMEEIYDTIKNAALIHKSGGGTGFSFSRLRPSGSSVKTTGGVASGPISFMKVFNASTEAVKQGGTRRGANMGTLLVNHPDIRSFIECKKDTKELTNFNISIAITDDFMTALITGEDYDLVDPRTKRVVGQENTRDIFNLIIDGAWNNGEPGVIFIDKMNRDNLTPSLGAIETPNPCGEQPLLAYESCNLGSINLANMFKDGKIDFEHLRRVVRLAVLFLDNVIEINQYPLAKIEEMTKTTRKIGLGVMGYADLLIKLGIPYNDPRAIEIATSIMSTIKEEGTLFSENLAQSRGKYPHCYANKEEDLGRRNCTITTIAPTGTISMIADCSSGIEPLLGISYYKEVLDGVKMSYLNESLENELKGRGLYTKELKEKILKEGTLANIPEIPKDLRKLYICAQDIEPEWHIKTQAAFQKFTDNAVSKTINMPNSATKKDVYDAYMLAYELDCKGLTVYRDGSRDVQVLYLGTPKAKQELVSKVIPGPRDREKTLSGVTEKMKTGCGKLYVTVNHDDQGVAEVLISTGKSGGCPSQTEATARLISLALRSAIPVEEVVEQLRGIRCFSTIKQSGCDGISCPDSIGRMINKISNQIDKQDTPIIKIEDDIPMLDGTKAMEEPLGCPECGAPLEHSSGCIGCSECGWSKCM